MASPGSFASMHRLGQGGSAAACASDSEATGGALGQPDELHPRDTKKGGAVAVEALVIACMLSAGGFGAKDLDSHSLPGCSAAGNWLGFRAKP